MIDFPPLTTSDQLVVIPLALSLVGFLLFWFVFHSPQIKAKFHDAYEHDVACLRHIFWVKAWGFVVMGVVPALVMNSTLGFGLADLGVVWPAETSGAIWSWTLGLGVIVVLVAWLGARKFDPQYPQVQAKTWTKNTMVVNWLGWAFYLAGYEFLFRGVLLFPLVQELGAWPAVAINTVLYSATHVPKGRDEAIGAIPLGFLLCWVTIETGSLWPATLVHIFMAWTNTTVRFLKHPEMNWKH
ncbi:MAG: CPBP family intramembrane glutamic endopeptidase [Flavobacteriales bacterium]